MSTRGLILFLLACACGALAWLCARQYQALVLLRASALERGDRSALQRQIWSTQKRIAAAQAGLSRQPVTASQETGPDEARESSRESPPSFQEMRQRYLSLLRDPQYRALQDVAVRARIQQDFAALFRQLHLPADQQRQLEDMAVERFNVGQDVILSASDQGIDPQSNPKAFSAAMKAATDLEDQKIKALIGDQAFAQAAQYMTTAPQRAVVSQLQQSMSYTQTPLSDDQASQLVQLLAANKAPANPGGSLVVMSPNGPLVMGGGMGAIGPGGTAAAPISDSALTLSAGVLSGPQVEALRQVQQLQQNQRRLGQILRQAQGAP